MEPEEKRFEVIKDYIPKLREAAMPIEIWNEALICPHCLEHIKVVTAWTGTCPHCRGEFGVKVILEKLEEWAGNDEQDS